MSTPKSAAASDVIPADVLVSLARVALIDMMRPPSYWEMLKQGDENIATHDVIPARHIGAGCSRCSAINNGLRKRPCGGTSA